MLIPHKINQIGKHLSRFFWSAVFLCVVLARTSAQENKTEYFSPEKILDFAEWLYHTHHEYGRAGDEYARYVFLAQSPNDSVLFRLAMCRKREGKLSAAEELFNKVPVTESPSLWACKSVFHTAHIAFLSGRYTESLDQLTKDPGTRCTSESGRCRQLQVCDMLETKQWEQAGAVINASKPVFTNDDELALRLLLEEGKTMEKKSPLKAGIFSALLPGAGKVYVSEWQDGLYAFLYVAMTGYLSYTGFHDDGSKSVKGWIFGAFSMTLYAGNIYGSVKSAESLNVRIETDFFDKVKRLCETLGSTE